MKNVKVGVSRLVLQYATVLEQLWYSEGIRKPPNIADGRVLSKLNHFMSRNRSALNSRMRREKYNSHYGTATSVLSLEQ